MPELQIKDIVYTETALANASSIKKYLFQKFSEKEVDIFFLCLNRLKLLRFPFQNSIRKQIKRRISGVLF